MQQEGCKKRSNGEKRNFIPKQNTHDLLVGTLSFNLNLILTSNRYTLPLSLTYYFQYFFSLCRHFSTPSHACFHYVGFITHPDTLINASRFPLHTNMGTPKMPPSALASGPNLVGQQITVRDMWTMSQIFTSLWASLLTLFVKRITSISSGVLNTRLQRQKVVYYKEMCATGIFNVIFQRKNKKALWFSVFPGQGTTFVSICSV